MTDENDGTSEGQIESTGEGEVHTGIPSGAGSPGPSSLEASAAPSGSESEPVDGVEEGTAEDAPQAEAKGIVGDLLKGIGEAVVGAVVSEVVERAAGEFDPADHKSSYKHPLGG